MASAEGDGGRRQQSAEGTAAVGRGDSGGRQRGQRRVGRGDGGRTPMRAVTMRTGVLSRLELITPGHDSIAAAARALRGGRSGALRQMIAEIETAAGFCIIDRSAMPSPAMETGREFIREAQAAREQTEETPLSVRGREDAEAWLDDTENPSAVGLAPGCGQEGPLPPGSLRCKHSASLPCLIG